MKVSIDEILGSARKINAHRETPQGALGEKNRSESKKDSLSIDSRIDSRLDSLESEFKKIQTSLTANQILLNGLNLLREDTENGGKNSEAIINQTLLNNRRVLLDELGESPDFGDINNAITKVNGNVEKDISEIRRLQVELDNITAADLTQSPRADILINSIEGYFSGYTGSIEQISNINPDSVMRLTR